MAAAEASAKEAAGERTPAAPAAKPAISADAAAAAAAAADDKPSASAEPRGSSKVKATKGKGKSKDSGEGKQATMKSPKKKAAAGAADAPTSRPKTKDKGRSKSPSREGHKRSKTPSKDKATGTSPAKTSKVRPATSPEKVSPGKKKRASTAGSAVRGSAADGADAGAGAGAGAGTGAEAKGKGKKKGAAGAGESKGGEAPSGGAAAAGAGSGEAAASGDGEGDEEQPPSQRKRARAASLPKLSPLVPAIRPKPKPSRNKRAVSKLMKSVTGRGVRTYGKTRVRNRDAPPAIGCFSQAIRARGMIFVSGTLGADPANGNKMVKQKQRTHKQGKKGETDQQRKVEAEQMTATKQTRQAMMNIKTILEDAGSNLSSVVQMTIQVINLEQDFRLVDMALTEFFIEDEPARTVFEVVKLPRHARVQIDCQALTTG